MSPEIDADTARAISETHFGEKPYSVQEIVGGVMNKTFRLRYGESSYILQVDGLQKLIKWRTT